MKRFCIFPILLLTACFHQGPGRFSAGVNRPSDSLYTEEKAEKLYRTQPEKALVIIDSAVTVGNMTRPHADILRAMVLAEFIEDKQLDSARHILEKLMEVEEIEENPIEKHNVLDLLMRIARTQHNNERWIHWALCKMEMCRSEGDETEAMRTEAEIGANLYYLGWEKEGMVCVDKAITYLDSYRSFAQMDACIIAMKRKINLLYREKDRYWDIISLAKRIKKKVDDFQDHPDVYEDGSFRIPSEEERDNYCAFYRAQAYGFMAYGYAGLSDTKHAREYLDFFEASAYGQTLDGKTFIHDVWTMLGDWDKMTALYGEMEKGEHANDSVSVVYVEMLRGRAIIAENQGRIRDGLEYWKKYAELSDRLNTQLQQSKAHQYAANFRERDLQMEIQKEKAVLRQRTIILGAILLLFAASFLFIVAICYQFKQIKEKNKVLSERITQSLEYNNKPKFRKKQNFFA
ncbi:MAG: hypothetical protein IJ795_04450 [Bacteroidales bacterium]|nr:hypothetical protein [Bacteroidales bacterium]